MEDLIVLHSREDELVLNFPSETTGRVDGRYEVGLIWKDSVITLQNNRFVGERYLELLEKRLERDPLLKVNYAETIEKDLQKGHIKKLGILMNLSRFHVSGSYHSTLWYILINQERYGESVIQLLGIKYFP